MNVICLSVGRPVRTVRDDREYSTSINRRPAAGAVRLECGGFVGDRVADAQNHGGPDKAACVYPHEHYAHWIALRKKDLGVPSFGENLTSEDLLETQVCVGDTFRVGRAIVQVSQPRQPCWKLADKLSWRELPGLMTQTGRTGFYFRVLEEGDVAAGAVVELLDRPHPAMTIALAVRQVLTEHGERDTLAQLAGLSELSSSWRERIRKRLAR